MSLCKVFNIKTIWSTNQLTWRGHNANKFMAKIYENANYYLKRKFNLYVEWSTWIPFNGTQNKPRKIRTYYPPLSEEHKQILIESNKRRKGRKYNRKK